MNNNLILDWILFNWLEILGFITALFSIYLQIKQKAAYWPVSMLMVSLYIVIYYNSKFYADMSLQFYYLFVSVYGWYFWVSGKRERISKKKITVARTTKHQKISLLLLTIVFFGVISYILKNFTDSPIPYGDALTTAISFTATWLLAKKYIENWLLWLVANPISVGLYIYKGLYLTAILFIILSFLAVVGYLQWKKDFLKHEKDI
jgi:nicotinamide mononucleotide transporter